MSRFIPMIIVVLVALSPGCSSGTKRSDSTTTAPSDDGGGSDDSLYSGDPGDDGGDSDDSATDDGGSVDDAFEEGADFHLAWGFPQDLVVAAPFSRISPNTLGSSTSKINTLAETALSGEGTNVLPTGVNDSHDFSRREIANLLYSATSLQDCAAPLAAIAQVSTGGCFAPTMDFQGHPDAGAGEEAGQMTPDGVWATDEDGAACVAGKTNQVAHRMSSMVETAATVGASIVCASRLSGNVLNAGENDMIAEYEKLRAAATVDLPPVSTATLHLEGSAAERRFTWSFTYEIDENVERENGQTNVTRVDSVILHHYPLSQNGSSYRGNLMIYRRTKGVAEQQSCFNFDNLENGEEIQAVGLFYEKSDADSLYYQTTAAEFVPIAQTSHASLFDSRGQIDLTDNFICKRRPVIMRASINPATGTGKAVYSWTDSSTSENARTLIADTMMADGKRVGCGYFGHAGSMQQLGPAFLNTEADATIAHIDRFICNKGGPSVDTAGMALVQRQCMELVVNGDANTGTWQTTSSNITYAPQNNCEQGSGNSGFQLMSVATPPLAGWDGFQEAPQSHDLLPIVDGYSSGQDDANATLAEQLHSPAVIVPVPLPN